MKDLLVRLVIVIIAGAVIAGVLSGLAGRWDLWNVWAAVGIFVVLGSLQTLALHRKNPGLFKEQMQPAGRELRGRRPLHIGFNLMFFLALIIAGLDQRFHWSDVIPPAGVVAGLVIFATGVGLYLWAMLSNPFFSSIARIQADRGQRVISKEPYGIVRHPGYAGLLLFVIAFAVALNSLLSIIPAVAAAACLAGMTALEDRMLRDELAGYADYAAKVRYRLIPGVW
jgi:protein-S-isoprenylcysteine O-methyltransferase Ste14